MKTFQCATVARVIVQVQVDAENKQEAANKAMAFFKENGDLVLWKSVGGMWTGPDETDWDEEIEVTMQLEDGPPYWDEHEFVIAEETDGR